MSLKTELEAFAGRVGNLETADAAKAATISQQGLMITDLTQRLADCEDTDPPPPPPPPPPDSVQIDPGDDLNKAIASEGVGRPFLLLDGAHSQKAPVALKDNIEIIGESVNAVVTGSGPTGHHFYAGTATGVTLSGFTVQDFGGHTTGQDAAVFSGGTGWLITGLVMHRTDNTFIRGNTNWGVHDCTATDAGRYAFAGSNFTIRNFTGARLGWKTQGVTVVGDNNRGASKFGRASKGVKVFGSTLTSCWQGWWWDIANEDGECWDLDATDVARMGLNLEAGYFGPAGVGPGFKGGRIKIRNAGQVVKDTETNWPAPCDVQISLSGNVDLSDLDLDDGRVGVGLVNSKDHAQLKNSLNTLARMGVGNIKLSGVVGANYSKWGLASNGTAHDLFPIRQPDNIDVSGLTVNSPISRKW